VLDLSTAGSDYDTTLAVHPDACGALGPFLALACNDDDLALGDQSRLFVAVDQGETVLIEVTGGGSLTLDVRYAPEGHPGSDGPEFQVNTYTADDQGYYLFPHTHAMCAAADGDFVIVWESQGAPFPMGQDGSMAGVFGQLYDASGAPQGGEFQVNQTTTGDQYYPSIGCAQGGEFVVTWRNGSYSPAPGISARRFDATGAPATGDVAVTALGGSQSSVGIDPTGHFLVVTTDGGKINARRYDSAGVLGTPAFEVNEPTLDNLRSPDVAVNAVGDFVVVWGNLNDGQIHGRRLDPTGAFVGAEFPVSLDGGQRPTVSIDPAGGFVVAWNGDDPLGYKGIQARTFDSGGTPGPVFTVNDFDDENVVTQDVAVDEDGNFVVVWEDYYYTESVLARRFLADGTPIGDIEFAVPTVREYMQHAPHVAAQPGGDFVVAWVGYDGYDYDQGYFTGGYGVKARRLRIAPPPPCPPEPRPGCKQPTVLWKGEIQLRDNTPDAADNFTWKWVKGAAVTAAEIGDPLVTDVFAYCVYDATDGLVMESIVPPGATCGTQPCWKDLGGTGFKYIDKAGTHAAGIRKLVLKAGAEGGAKVIVKGKGDGLDMPTLPLSLPVRAQLASSAGTCWEAEFQPAGVLDNTAAEFHAKAYAD
jgi:hypothetical protein